MSQSKSGLPLNRDELNQLSKAELVQIVLTQQKQARRTTTRNRKVKAE